MANGANRLFDVIKQTGVSTNGIASQVVSLTIKSVNPLILMRDDRLEIPAEFCILHKSLNIDTFRINDIVTAIVLNNGQQYLILYNNTAEEQGIDYNDLDNKPKINNVELKGNKTSDDLLIVSKSELQQVVAEMVDNINNKVTKSGDEMTGQLNMQSNSLRFGTSGNIFWKEDGFGDKFRILPYFSGSGSDNKLVIQSTNGDAGTDPQNWKDLVYIHADTGLIELADSLLFNNKSDYAAIRKTRTINGTDYQLSVGVGGNGSARMEYVSNNNVLGSIEVGSNGLYNGVSGKKLAEQSTGWTNATLSSYIAGTVRYTKIGNIVIVSFFDVHVKSNLSHAVVLASGLPTSTVYQMTVLKNFDASGYMRIAVNPSGQIVDHYSSNTVSNNSYYGTLIYITNQ